MAVTTLLSIHQRTLTIFFLIINLQLPVVKLFLKELLIFFFSLSTLSIYTYQQREKSAMKILFIYIFFIIFLTVIFTVDHNCHKQRQKEICYRYKFHNEVYDINYIFNNNNPYSCICKVVYDKVPKFRHLHK